MSITLPTAIAAIALGALALLAARMLARDLAILFLRAIGHLPGAPVYGASRSGRWPKLERDWLKLHDACAACGSTDQVSVHHKMPFHLAPERELDPANLISLCEKHGCHFSFGHNYDWHAYNLHVEEDARLQSRRVQQRKYEQT